SVARYLGRGPRHRQHQTYSEHGRMHRAIAQRIRCGLRSPARQTFLSARYPTMTAAVSTFFATDEFDADTFDPLAHGFRHYGAFGFENFMGPFYVREADEGFELLVKVEDRHTNALDAAHGGFML